MNTRNPLRSLSPAALRAGALLLGLTLATGGARADDWTGADKSRHLLAGAFIAAAATAASRDEFTGFAAGTAAGLLKELHDAAGHGKPSTKDFLVTVLGAYLGAKLTGYAITPDGVAYTFHWRFQ